MIQFAQAVDGDGDPYKVTDKCEVGMEEFGGDLRELAVKARPQGDEIRRVHGYKIIQDKAKRHDLPSLQ